MREVFLNFRYANLEPNKLSKPGGIKGDEIGGKNIGHSCVYTNIRVRAYPTELLDIRFLYFSLLLITHITSPSSPHLFAGTLSGS